ncbi:glycosyl transferase family 1, partial [Neisseria meningitidis]
ELKHCTNLFYSGLTKIRTRRRSRRQYR